MNKSARELANEYLNAKTAPARKKIRDEVAARAETSKRARWGRLLAAMDAGDTLRVKAYAASGAEKSKLWAQVRKAEGSDKPKAAAKKSTTRKRKAASKPKAANPLDELSNALAGMDEAAFVSFLTEVTQKRAAK